MRRLLAFVFVLFLGFSPIVYAQKTPEYLTAEESFMRLPLEGRITLQTFMTAVGYWNAVPNENFSNRLYRAIITFQAEHGFEKTGFLFGEQLEKLIIDAFPYLQMWGFKPAYHLSAGAYVMIPFGLNLRASKTDTNGFIYTTNDNNIKITFDYYNIDLKYSFDNIKQMQISNGAKIHYAVNRDGFFVISYSFSDGTDGYMRFHQKGGGIVGFIITWNGRNNPYKGERIAILMSVSLWAEMKNNNISAPYNKIVSSFGESFNAPTPVNPPSPPLASAPPPPTQPAPSQPKEETFSTGTGFFVNADGYLLTNAHVIKTCSNVVVSSHGSNNAQATVIAQDNTNDLALLKAPIKPPAYANFRSQTRLGESVAVFGFPLVQVLSSSGNFTLGNITALSGANDNINHVQISAPVQPGNSGGPLLDQRGNVIGVIVSKLSNNSAQNANFAIKASVALNLLNSKEITFENVETKGAPFQPEDLADYAKRISAFVICK